MLSLKVTTSEAGSDLVLPEDVLASLKLRAGDTLYLSALSDGSYRLTTHRPDSDRQRDLAERIMHEDRDILRALAR